MGASFHGDDWFVVGTLFPVVGEMRLLRPLAIASMCGFGVKTQRGAFFLFVHKLRRCWPTTHGGEKVDDGHVPLGDQLPQPSDGRHPTIRHWLQDFVTATQAQAKKKKKMMMHKHAPNPGFPLCECVILLFNWLSSQRRLRQGHSLGVKCCLVSAPPTIKLAMRIEVLECRLHRIMVHYRPKSPQVST
ncbi:hypothetical protein BHE74_00003563 [Ensete ventricosum]|nr:hypothetical protein BHE74_00003563 [Ensete ventricosum]